MAITDVAITKAELDSLPRWPVPDEKSKERLESLDDVRRYIDELDLSGLKDKLAAPPEDGGSGWSRAKVDYFELLYKNWLFLRRKFEGEMMPPHAHVDEFWHTHILDTRAYFRDCDRIFGYYFHHFPYLGTRGPSDHELLMRAWKNTQRRYREEYGDYIYDFDEPT